MNSKEVEILEEIASKLDRVFNLMIAINHEKIGQILQNELDTKEKQQVYELVDGSYTVRQIAEKTGVNIGTISRWSQRWEKIGIIVESRRSDVPGRREKMFEPAVYERD